MSRVQAGGGITVCPSLGSVGCKGHVHYPAFTPDLSFLFPALQSWQLDLLILFVSCPEFAPNCALVLMLFLGGGP